jgi:hypothetical protein
MHKELVLEDISKHTKNPTPISAQALREKFGSSSDIYPDIKETLESLWKEVKEEQGIKVKVDNWTNTIKTLYGYKPDISLFLDHTYLIILAKIAVYLKFENSANRDEILDVIPGNILRLKALQTSSKRIYLYGF